MLLEVLAVFGSIFGFCFLTLSIASGLYYISEIVEEYSEPTRRFLNRAIYVIIATLVLLWALDGLPLKLVALSIVSHIVYKQNLVRFPIISLASPTFISSCILVVLNHYLWFRYFNHIEIPPQFAYDPNYMPRKRASFAEVASFFALCVWFIPFALFVSLSAGDYLLATSTRDAALQKMDKSKKHTGLVRVVINSIRDNINLFLETMGLKRSKPQPLL
ncbi:Protein SVP26 [Nakaseomyces bracarensis]|uniref:Protein SVP26 n=1 Tax=Nakaseomyces bracarensis TaxID=273131 RepID=A0ABR4NRQ5_9SACH